MDPTVLAQMIAALKDGHYLALIILITLYLRKLASPTSKFPLNIPTTWLSTVTATGGLVYGFEMSLQDGASFGTATLSALAVAASSGFFDGLVTAIFAHGQAPSWAKALVFLVDDVAGSSGSNSTGTGSFAPPAGPKPADPPKPPAAARHGLVLARTGLIATLVMLMSCATLQALIPELTTIENKICTDLAAGDGDVQIVNDVESILGANATEEAVTDLVLSTITNLLSSGLLAKHYSPAVVAQAKTVQSSLQAKVASRPMAGKATK
ncbi:MAG: hypothetical protein ACLP1X_00155 [Polyangiaceae bacterium]